MIYISSDHRGFELKKHLIEHLQEKGEPIEDVGPFSYNPSDDYPDFVAKLVEKMSDNPDSRGIVICKNGVGVSIAANRHPRIRAALSWNKEHAISSRSDDNSNVLALPSYFISQEEAVTILDSWLDTPFAGEERHTRRITKLA